MLEKCWRKGKVQVAFFFRFYSSKQKKEAVLKQESIQANIKLHKKKENAIFCFWVKSSTSAIIHFFGSKIYALSGVMQYIIKSLALLVVYS